MMGARMWLWLGVICSVGEAGLSRYFQPLDDPTATRDPFHELPAEVLAELSTDSGSGLSQMIEELQTLQHTTHIEVVLIGFDGDGNQEVNLDEGEFHKYLDAVTEHDSIHIVGDGQQSAGHVAQRRQFVFHVTKASKSVHSRLTRRLASAIEEATKDQPMQAVVGLPYTVVDDFLRTEYLKDTSMHKLYIFNPEPPMVRRSSKDVAKSLDPSAVDMMNAEAAAGGDRDQAEKEEKFWDAAQVYHYDEGSDEGTAGGRLCGTNLWVGKERYWWVDLTAGPVTYGPAMSGQGLVTSMSTPRIDRFVRADNAGFLAQELTASLSAFVRRTADTLLNPPLRTFPVKYYDTVSIHVFVIHDGASQAVRSSFLDYDDEEEIPEEAPPSHAQLLDLETIETEIQALRFSDQDVHFHRSEVSFVDCELCTVAYTQSTRSHNSNVLHHQGVQTRTHRYLDSKDLHRWLQSYALEFWDILPDDEIADYTKIIPVFLFDVSASSVMLLDRFHQAVAFDDMVVAVHTQAGMHPVDFQCNNEHVSIDTADATRPILAALLQTGWGVVPQSQSWNFGSLRTNDDHLLVVGNTPFGYFSTRAELSFAAVDTARRNIIYSTANHTMQGLSHVLEHIVKFEKETDTLLDSNSHRDFVRRWNLFKYKIDQAVEMHTLQQYSTSLYYFKSADHDVHALWRIVNDAAAKVHSFFDCVAPQATSTTEYMLVLLSAALVLLATQSHRLAFKSGLSKLS